MEELTKKDFKQVYDLLKISFIADELRPYDEQKSLLKEPIYHIYAERDQLSDWLKGIVAIWNFEDFVFIDYLAIHPKYRKQGLGGYFLERLKHMTNKEICLEIETPIDYYTYRRLKFYQKHNFILCKRFYHQPPIARGNAPVALSLMSSKEITNTERFENIKSVIYKYAYERFI